MVERLSIVKNNDFNNENDQDNRITKTHSFNTDDDELLLLDASQQPSKNSPKTSKSHELQRSFLSINSLSIESLNDQDGSVSDSPLLEKIKKKKQRRLLTQMSNTDIKKQVIKKRSWYKSRNFIKPIICVAILFLIYLMWVKRDVWISRLLTSNTRVRHTTIIKEHKIKEKIDSSPTLSTKDFSPTSTHQDEIIRDNDNNNNNSNNNNNINNDQTSLSENAENSTTTSNKASSSQKINLRTRRAKISFSKDRPTKKGRHVRYQLVEDDNDNEDDDDDDDDDDDENIIKPIKVEEPILPSSIHSSKKHHHHHHHQSAVSYEENLKIPINSKTNIILPEHDDIIEQLKKLIKTRGRHRDLLTTLIKETGLNKAKLNRFIHEQDYSIITLDVFISFLNSFDSTILIVPK